MHTNNGGWGAKTAAEILEDIKKARLALHGEAKAVSELRIIRAPQLPPGTMLVADDVFDMMSQVKGEKDG
ncbi:hypothetical protein D3C81_442130 [compost metagenome]